MPKGQEGTSAGGDTAIFFIITKEMFKEMNEGVIYATEVTDFHVLSMLRQNYHVSFERVIVLLYILITVFIC